MATRLRALGFRAPAILFVLLLASSAQALPMRFVTIQPIQVCMDDGTGCAQTGTFEAETDKIWAQADVDIVFLDTVQFNETDFLTVDITNSGADEFSTLMNPGHGQHSNTMVLNMWFVDDIDNTDSPSSTVYGVGCGPAFGAYCDNKNGVLIADEVFSFNANNGRRDTIAHEAGHVFGLGHSNFGAGAADNLMTTGSSRTVPGGVGDITPDGAELSKLTNDQITEARTSMFMKTTPIPEPGTFFLTGAALLGLGVWRRRLR